MLSLAFFELHPSFFVASILPICAFLANLQLFYLHFSDDQLEACSIKPSSSGFLFKLFT
jgi:hypothetical protein